MPPDRLILGFDTSAAHCAAALLSGDNILAVRFEPMAKGQAERLMPLLEETLVAAGVRWRDLHGIGVGTGPGNFTGIRIAVAAARGLALGLGIPAIGVTGLRALAFRMASPIRVALAAPRGELYVQDFDGEAALSAARVSTVEQAWPEPQGPVPVGDWPEPPTHRRDLRPAVPDMEARIMAIPRIVSNGWAPPHPRPAPFYLRSADAAPPADPPPLILP